MSFLEYWLSHPKSWFVPHGEKRIELNNELVSLFKNSWLNLVKIPIHQRNCNLENILLLDQLSRHYREVEELKDIAESVINTNSALYISFCLLKYIDRMTPEQQVFTLMPLRHSNRIALIDMAINIINRFRSGKERDRNSTSHHIYLRFLRASINQKIKLNSHIAPLQVNELVASDFRNCLDINTYDRVNKFNFEVRLNKKLPIVRSLLPINKNQTQYVSLSGGVDSMCLSFLLTKLGYDVKLIHIATNTNACELQFIKWWANQLKISLYVYNRNELTRNQGDRKFYEEMTRKLRFSFYHRIQTHCGQGPVLLGHILDDLHENLLSNIMLNRQPMKCGHRGMAPSDVQDNVEIYRPLYWISKKHIYDFAEKYNIPYTLDSTPDWSRRGKLRKHLIPLIEQIYGKSALNNLVELSKMIENQESK